MDKKYIVTNNGAQSFFMDMITLITVSFLTFGFISNLKKILWPFKSAWYSNGTSRSVSSPTTIVSAVTTDSMAFDAVKVSASLFVWYTVHPTDSSFLPSELINACLFDVFNRNSSFFTVGTMSSSNCTTVPFLPPVRSLVSIVFL